MYLWPSVIALGFAALVIFLNLRGAGAAAKFSSFLTKALLTGMEWVITLAWLAIGVVILAAFGREKSVAHEPVPSCFTTNLSPRAAAGDGRRRCAK